MGVSQCWILFEIIGREREGRIEAEKRCKIRYVMLGTATNDSI